MWSSEVDTTPLNTDSINSSTLITNDLTAKDDDEENKQTSLNEPNKDNDPIEINESNITSDIDIINVTVHKQQPTVSYIKIKPLKISVPRISSRDLVRAHRSHSPLSTKELDQMSELMLSGPGARREVNKQIVKLKNPELEECVKRAKKYAMEQSVRFVLVKQQQQQQKQQLDLIKKQQALLLMCR